MLGLIKELRSDPKRYRTLQAKVARLKTDTARAKALTDFVVTDTRLVRVIGPGTDAIGPTVTTVTVTTVIILVPSAY